MTEPVLCQCGRSWPPERVHDLVLHLVLVHEKWAPVLVAVTEFREWQKQHRLHKRGPKPRAKGGK